MLGDEQDIPVQDSSGEAVKDAVVCVDNIEFHENDNSPYAVLVGHDGTKFSVWDDHYDYVERHHDDIVAAWCKVLYVRNGRYKNVRGVTEPDESEIPDTNEVEEDPLAGIPRDVCIRNPPR